MVTNADNDRYLSPPTQALERTLELASKLAARLDSDELLSRILPAAKGFFERVSDDQHAQLMRFEMYGGSPPPTEQPMITDRPREQAILTFARLHAIADVEAVADSISRGNVSEGGRRLASRDAMLTTNSIEKIERSVSAWPDREARLQESLLVDEWTKASISVDELREVLHRVRMYVTEQIQRHLLRLERELANHHLVGADYKVVLDCLSALDTHVGDELQVALNGLHSDTPASLNAAVLTCRNVILALGRTLWQIDGGTYNSELAQRALSIEEPSEKNQLCAFIDQHYRLASPESKARLLRADELARAVYDLGSKGKNRVTHDEARRAVVDTFRLVSELLELTDLTPLSEYLAPPKGA